MDTLLMVLGVLLILIGLAGSLLPLLPGPPLAYVALLIQLFRDDHGFSTQFLLIWAGILIVVLVLDYLIPLWGTKKYGGSSYGIWGCAIGLILGMWFGPLGIILGPFAGAYIGEMLYHRNSDKAFRAATGAFIGFLFGSLLKVIYCIILGYYLIKSF